MSDSTHEFVRTVHQRAELLDALSHEPKDKRELVAELSVSRSTVDRGTRELESMGLVEYVDGRFQPTVPGRNVVTEYTQFEETMDTVRRLLPFLRNLPESESEIDLDMLADARLVVPEPGNPHAMENRHIEAVRNATAQKLFLPVTGLHATEVSEEMVVQQETTCELVVDRNVATTFRTVKPYRDAIESMTATGRYEVYEYDGELPFFAGVFDETVQIGVTRDDVPQALVEMKSDAAREWFERRYQQYKANATPLTETLGSADNDSTELT